jgi:hypothetical protein
LIKVKFEPRRFLGLCTYYWRFVIGFTGIAKKVTQLTEEMWTFKWCRSHFLAYEVIAYGTCPRIPSLVRSSSRYGRKQCGTEGVLPQMQVSQDHAVTYYGRTLSKIERNNCMT